MKCIVVVVVVVVAAAAGATVVVWHEHYASTFETIDREFVTSEKNSRILTNFPKLKKNCKIVQKFVKCPSGRCFLVE